MKAHAKIAKSKGPRSYFEQSICDACFSPGLSCQHTSSPLFPPRPVCNLRLHVTFACSGHVLCSATLFFVCDRWPCKASTTTAPLANKTVYCQQRDIGKDCYR